MDCQKVEEFLSAYLDNELPDEEKAQIAQHLESCAGCREEYQALVKTVAALAALPEIDPPAHFRRELFGRLEKKYGPKGFSLRSLLPKKGLKIRLSTWMPLAAAFVLLIVVLPGILNIAGAGMSTKSEEIADSMPQMADRGSDSGFLAGQPAAGDQAYSAESRNAGGAGESPAPAADGDGTVTFKMMATSPEAPGLAAGAENVAVAERKIIKNADVSVRVDDYPTAADILKKKVADLGGYIASESVSASKDGSVISGHIQARVPAARFDEFLDGMDLLGTVTGRHVNAQDVTEEYIDVESRLKAMKVKEERLLAILAQSGKLSDILAVENELANTRANLESLEGRLRYLDNRTDFSNIGINLQQTAISSQQITATGWKGLAARSKAAFIKAINNILQGAGQLVVLISTAIPYLVIIALVGLGLRWWLKKRKK